MSLFDAVGLAGVLTLAFLLRIVPSWCSPHGLGVDHWYWRSYIEEYRRNRQFPPHLPKYVLDQAQWYPPVFPLLMARLPAVLFEGWAPQISVLIDLIRLVLLLGVAAWQTSGNWTVMLLAGLVYATTPIQISYNIQLNPRGLAAIMLDAFLMALLWAYQGGPAWLWGAMVGLGGLILLTHKMTTQLFWFLALGTALVYRWWELLLLIPGSIAAAFIMSRGFYVNVLRAHWDIVSFWARNWPWIGADPIRESPVYGDGQFQRPEKLHKPGLRGLLWHGFILVGFSPAAWIACLLVYERLFIESPLLIYPTPFLVWLLLICGFAGLTAFVPWLKSLGAGYLYVYNSSLLASLVLALTFQFTRAPQFSTPFVLLAIALNIAGLLVYYHQLLGNRRTRVDDEMAWMIEHLREQPRGVVMCVPTNWSEVVAYKTDHQVLWGAHGYGFRLLEPTWPRLLIPIKEVIARYGVRYLLTMDEMLPSNFVAELPAATEIHRGDYRLYSFELTRAAPDGPESRQGRSRARQELARN